MAKVTIVIEDTLDDKVDVTTRFDPPLGGPGSGSLAQLLGAMVPERIKKEATQAGLEKKLNKVWVEPSDRA